MKHNLFIASIAAVAIIIASLLGFYCGNKYGFSKGFYYGQRADSAKQYHGQPYADFSTEEPIKKGDLLQVLYATCEDSTQGAKDTLYLGYPVNPIVDMPEEPVSVGDKLQVLRISKLHGVAIDTIFVGYLH